MKARNELSAHEQEALQKRDVLFDAAEDLEVSCPGVRVMILLCEGPYVQGWHRSCHDRDEMKVYLRNALERWEQ